MLAEEPTNVSKAVIHLCARCWILVLCLVFQSRCEAAQFVELTAEIEINDWDHWFLEDKGSFPKSAGEFSKSPGEARSIFKKGATVHCVIGTNTWLMEGDFYRNSKARRWFTGTNIIDHSVITQELPETETQMLSQSSKFAFTNPLVGHQSTRTYQTADGNPGRPVRVSDFMELRGRICWLAFCSGSALKRDGRKLFPPSDLWKELLSASSGFTDKTTVFEDGLGLPRSVELFTRKDQLIFQYQVRQSTNVLGWNFPLELYGVQYRPVQTNGWAVQLTVKGKVTAIGVGTEPKILPISEKTAEK
jgi:hypothetical protein